MASYPVIPDETSVERQMTVEEHWDLILNSYGSSRELFASLGGGEAFLRAERAAWAEEELA